MDGPDLREQVLLDVLCVRFLRAPFAVNVMQGRWQERRTHKDLPVVCRHWLDVDRFGYRKTSMEVDIDLVPVPEPDLRGHLRVELNRLLDAASLPCRDLARQPCPPHQQPYPLLLAARDRLPELRKLDS